jgi:hypothetical protein
MKPDDLYSRAREILLAEPTMGKKRLADRLCVRTPMARGLLWRFRGETQGHSPEPVYQRVRKLKEANPDWGAGRIAQALRISEDRVMLNLARWTEAQQFKGRPLATPGDSGTAATADTPNAGSTLQDDVGGTTRDLWCRGSQVRSLEDLLVYAQVDTSVWEVERWTSNQWEVGARNPATSEILTSPLFEVKAWLRRKVIATSLRELAQESPEKEAPAPASAKYSPKREGTLEIAMFDFDRKEPCSGNEDGRESKHKIASRVFWCRTTIKNHHRLDSRILLPSLDRCLNRMLPNRGNVWKLSANQHGEK